MAVKITKGAKEAAAKNFDNRYLVGLFEAKARENPIIDEDLEILRAEIMRRLNGEEE